MARATMPARRAAIDPGRGRAGAHPGREAKLQLHSHRRLQLVPLAGPGVGRGRLRARAAAVGAARDPAAAASMMPSPERLIDLNVVGAASMAWELFDFGMNGVPKNAYTDAAVRADQGDADAGGNWSANESRRPPMNAGEFQAAALAHLCDQALHAGRRRSEQRRRRSPRPSRGSKRAQPETTQDRAFHALALAWAMASPDSARRPLARSRACSAPTAAGASCRAIESDAYATGQALYALNVAGSMPATDPVYPEGDRLSAPHAGRRRHVAREVAIDLAAAVFRKRLPVRPGSVHLDGRHRVGVAGLFQPFPARNRRPGRSPGR